MTPFFLGMSILLLLGVFTALYRAFRGPNILDRVLTVSLIGTNTLVALILISYIYEYCFLDVALAYALLSFISIVVMARYIESKGKF
ncbi:monovalent cation/H+ antiporter complex subunit F [Candidatus Oleimmundimicrobium sp.]|uniref:monovalent cation/H+ antiporter complex subunit F n=1 Tax=Candidatus Oleimmundimicrobium sp. TaxID=3060597 RepID=UPI002721E7FE|nr:monovalent cation/H+ antiporter complex subunit F [Candidatus Oleimmundimicrobium sp.]MDO8886900.1 monovalent cation/H+ antiporter complex subunit F [Candidatus Oleimmundimicrobium sp.]